MSALSTFCGQQSTNGLKSVFYDISSTFFHMHKLAYSTFYNFSEVLKSHLAFQKMKLGIA